MHARGAPSGDGVDQLVSSGLSLARAPGVHSTADTDPHPVRLSHVADHKHTRAAHTHSVSQSASHAQEQTPINAGTGLSDSGATPWGHEVEVQTGDERQSGGSTLSLPEDDDIASVRIIVLIRYYFAVASTSTSKRALYGGVVNHGEDPLDAAIRLAAAQGGIKAEPGDFRPNGIARGARIDVGGGQYRTGNRHEFVIVRETLERGPDNEVVAVDRIDTNDINQPRSMGITGLTWTSYNWLDGPPYDYNTGIQTQLVEDFVNPERWQYGDEPVSVRRAVVNSGYALSRLGDPEEDDGASDEGRSDSSSSDDGEFDSVLEEDSPSDLDSDQSGNDLQSDPGTGVHPKSGGGSSTGSTSSQDDESSAAPAGQREHLVLIITACLREERWRLVAAPKGDDWDFIRITTSEDSETLTPEIYKETMEMTPAGPIIPVEMVPTRARQQTIPDMLSRQPEKARRRTINIVFDEVDDLICDGTLRSQTWPSSAWNEIMTDYDRFYRDPSIAASISIAARDSRGHYDLDSETQVADLERQFDADCFIRRLAWKSYMFTTAYSALVSILPLVWGRHLEGYESSPFRKLELFAEHCAFALYSHKVVEEAESIFQNSGRTSEHSSLVDSTILPILRDEETGSAVFDGLGRALSEHECACVAKAASKLSDDITASMQMDPGDNASIHDAVVSAAAELLEELSAAGPTADASPPLYRDVARRPRRQATMRPIRTIYDSMAERSSVVKLMLKDLDSDISAALRSEIGLSLDETGQSRANNGLNFTNQLGMIDSRC